MREFSAVIFDLDGVITRTALVHGEAWKRMFDDYLRTREARFGEMFKEFTHSSDYLPYVDGKPRYKGVLSFLESRGIEIPFGDPSDPDDRETVCGLGNKKNTMFNLVLEDKGVETYESTVSLLHELKKEGIRIGVASSSKNCKSVLERAGLIDLFETRVDGVVSAELGLNGKPEADIFTTACDNLGVSYNKSVVVEDAVSGVQAGQNGNFGLVIGVAREDNTNDLLANGADIVVEDLEEISIERINDWFNKGIHEDGWNLTYYDYDKEKERSRETLLTSGNGYFGTRGAMNESRANKVNYPGTYIAGLYNRLTSKVGDREVDNEDFVNIPNYLPIKFKIGDGEWFEFKPDPTFKINRIKRRLDFRKGELVREMEVEDDRGRKTLLLTSRFAGMHYHHLAGIKYNITPLNYSDKIIIRSELDGNHINAGVERYSQLNQDHIYHLSEKTDGNKFFIEVITKHSNVTVALGAKHILNGSEDLEELIDCKCSKGRACQDYTIEAREGVELSFEKLVSLYTSKDTKVITPSIHTVKAIKKMEDYNAELALSAKSWKKIWKRIDIELKGDRLAQKLIRLHLYHMIVTASPNHVKIDAGIPPRGLHGEAYRGHIFWDELYILPLYNISFPKITKSVLMYRYRRLDKARDNAREFGYKGAMFPWQSGSDGREETQVVHLNPVSGEWGDDYSSLQRHISLAIAFNVWNYYWSTMNTEFMLNHGAEIMFEISRFWAGKCEYDKKLERYHIAGVMGPDEFHEKLPGAKVGGLTDNAYTNIMVGWMLSRCVFFIDNLKNDQREALLNRLKLSDSEIEAWNDIRTKLNININTDGIIEQFQGYFDLSELDWEGYRKKYGDIHRLDRILKAEGKSPDEYKLSKQADLIMAFYNLGIDGVSDILNTMGYKLDRDYFSKNFDYYIERTSHGSTLSRLVHSSLEYLYKNRQEGWLMYMDALKSDLVDIQGGTTGEGIHAGVMGGTVYKALCIFGGLDISGDIPSICPILPDHWDDMKYGFKFRDSRFKVMIAKDEVELFAENSNNKKIKVHIYGELFEMESKEILKVKYRKEYRC